ncbi:MAG: hypothetical protein IKZ84_11610 [Victivallales bacterium]|nr:hypothetical protein [Victivallales bacterium]
MYTFTELIQMETIRAGKRKWKKEGIEEGKTEAQLTAYANMKKLGYDDNTICSIFGITMRRLATLKKLLSASINLEPKTV